MRGNTWIRAGAAWSLVSGEHRARVYRVASGGAAGSGAEPWAWWVKLSDRAAGQGLPAREGRVIAQGRAPDHQLARDECDRALVRYRFAGWRHDAG